MQRVRVKGRALELLFILREREREREIHYMNIYKFVQYCMNRYINKDTIKPTCCALFINEGNHIAWSFEG